MTRVAERTARQLPLADRSELPDGRFRPVREVRVAVAELLGQVELEPLRERGASLGSGAVEGEALEHLLGRAQVALAVPSPLGLAALERGAAADRDEDVLQERAPRVVRVDVAGRDRLDAEVLGEVAQETEPPRVSPLERPLQLDVEALAAEGACQARRGVRVEEPETAPRAAGEADEPSFNSTTVSSDTEGGSGSRSSRPTRRVPACAVVSSRQRFAYPRRDSTSSVTWAPPSSVDLCACDRPHAERLRRVRELERAVDAVVVCERERLVPELGSARRELLRLRRAVEERVRRVACSST